MKVGIIGAGGTGEGRFEGSPARTFLGQFGALDFTNSVVLFGASLLLSVPAVHYLAELAGQSPVYFAAAIISDSRLYGTIGVVFTLLTWFIAIGAVIVLGAVAGATWDQRKGRARETTTGSSDRGHDGSLPPAPASRNSRREL